MATPLDAAAAVRPRVIDGKGLFELCRSCREIVAADAWSAALGCCPHCGHHAPLPARARIEATFDPGSFEEHDAGLSPGDPLAFTDSKTYPARVAAARRASGEGEALLSGVARLDGRPVSVGVFVFEFLGGSMGSVVGEKVTRVFERARERRIPAVVFTASGGARMHEGIVSLMQMAKTSAARAGLAEARVPYVSVLLDPTTGGVAASFAFQADVILAEPGALIGFAGPRVIEQTIGEALPEGFQRAEFCLEHGAIDAIVPRSELRARLSRLLALLCD